MSIIGHEAKEWLRMQNNNYQEQCTVIHSYTNTPTQTYFLEKLIYMYKITKYHFNNVKYFTRTRDQFTSELGLSARTISNHLSNFEKKGLIERKSKLVGAKKRLYIRLSDSFCALLGLDPHLSKETIHKPSKIQQEGEGVTSSKTTEQPQDCVFLNQLCPTEMANDARTYKEVNNNINQKPNSTVREVCIVNSCQKDLEEKAKNLDKSTRVEKAIGERITDRLKNYIKGTLANLQTQHKLKFSEPDKLYAEVVFSVLNTKEQLVGIDNPHHRVNIIAKLLRERRWSTPKGFYNHWMSVNCLRKKNKLGQMKERKIKRLNGAFVIITRVR